MNTYRAGIDIGSTTVKLVLIDEQNNTVYDSYKRHRANTQSALANLLADAEKTVGECNLKLKITGSGSINLAKALGVEFVRSRPR